MSTSLLISTTNTGKQIEMLALLKNAGVNLCLPQDLFISLKVEETGSTYSENARLKSTAFCKVSGLPALADDTGLEVDALDGAPGLFSARFSPKPHAEDSDRRALLISKLLPLPGPWTARFKCAMVLTLPDGQSFQSDGVCEGEIISQERGTHGFGYDAIFLCNGTNHTMAELLMGEKNLISHRAKAVQAMIPYIKATFT